jgi:hypothetical protein
MKHRHSEVARAGDPRNTVTDSCTVSVSTRPDRHSLVERARSQSSDRWTSSFFIDVWFSIREGNYALGGLPADDRPVATR